MSTSDTNSKNSLNYRKVEKYELFSKTIHIFLILQQWNDWWFHPCQYDFNWLAKESWQFRSFLISFWNEPFRSMWKYCINAVIFFVSWIYIQVAIWKILPQWCSIAFIGVCTCHTSIGLLLQNQNVMNLADLLTITFFISFCPDEAVFIGINKEVKYLFLWEN